MQAIFKALLKRNVALNEAQFVQLPFNVEADTVLLNRATGPLMLFKILEAFVSDITMQKEQIRVADLIKPSSQRIRRLFSCMVDYNRVLNGEYGARLHEVQSMHDGEKAIITRIISEADEKESKAMKTRAEHDARKRRENEHFQLQNVLEGKLSEEADEKARLADEKERLERESAGIDDRRVL